MFRLVRILVFFILFVFLPGALLWMKMHPVACILVCYVFLRLFGALSLFVIGIFVQ